MHMVAMAGTRHGSSSWGRATIGARGWWSLSRTNARWTSQSLLAKRYSPAEPMEAGTFVVLLLAGAWLFGQPGAVLAAGIGLACLFFWNPPQPSGLVCLRCGCEFQPPSEEHRMRS